MTRPPGQRGLTLVELIVALAIFAILGVLSYRALAEVATGRHSHVLDKRSRPERQAPPNARNSVRMGTDIAVVSVAQAGNL